MEDSEYVIRSRPPARAFFIAAVMSLVGAVGLWWSRVAAWPIWVSVAAGIVLGLGVLLLLLTIIAAQRNTVRLRLTDRGYEFQGPHARHRGQWRRITRVTQAHGGAQVSLYEGERRSQLVFGPGALQLVPEILDDMTERLNQAKQG
ncbi:MAG: hypothetical protein ACK5KO_02590 [Arachnia sp.]